MHLVLTSFSPLTLASSFLHTSVFLLTFLASILLSYILLISRLFFLVVKVVLYPFHDSIVHFLSLISHYQSCVYIFHYSHHSFSSDPNFFSSNTFQMLDLRPLTFIPHSGFTCIRYCWNHHAIPKHLLCFLTHSPKADFPKYQK